ncbi:MAG: hypothetical protein RL021_1156 [Bacteroidota bacterium]
MYFRFHLVRALLAFCILPVLPSISSALPDTLYTGAYELDGQDGFYIVLKKSGSGYVGFTGTSEKAAAIRGAVKGPMMEVQFTEGEDSTINYVVINEKNNLQLSDGMFTFFIFKRTLMNADSLYDRFSEKNNKSSPLKTSTLNSNAAYYAGKKFLHLKTGNGYSEKWAYYLFEDGSFRFKGDNSYVNSNASENFSGATATEDTGKWDVLIENDGEYLILNWTNGQKKRMRLMKTSVGYELNGTPYFLVGLTDYE